jgi:hypothetical protein
MHIKSFYTQQRCYASLKTLYPGRDLKPGLFVPEADAMSTAPRRPGQDIHFMQKSDKPFLFRKSSFHQLINLR